ncbi:hypothetical protein CRN32_23900 [Vibrio vulnificus]|uniref:AAA family ATPase n=1 Tax=Vibrio vulnificus TaxID=672 RepID=UPI000CD2F91D|nr:ATP-binding protein [Vibrio vulnificus]ELX4208050.1 AAA family ATPase [Vibrio vulnificus]POC46634.1 hypothetical protein CRN32_23900 [Vibrio vulnificus]
MLVTFRVTNYKSFGGTQTFDLRATSQNEFPESLYENNLLKVNKKACIIGPNGAGKSQLLRAIDLTTQVIKSEELSKLSQPYRLNDLNPTQPSKFEIVVYSKKSNSLLSYTLSVFKGKVVEESLYSRNNNKNQHKKLIFERTEDGSQLATEYSSHEPLLANISNKRLIVSVLYGLGIEAIDQLQHWTRRNFFLQPEFVGISASQDVIESFLDSQLDDIEDMGEREKILKEFEANSFEYISKFDLKVKGINFGLTNEGKTFLNVIPETKSSEHFTLTLKEAKDYYSSGTFTLIVLFLYLGLMKGSQIEVLAFDEIDSSFHHKLTKELINIVVQSNAAGQLIMTTHDILLLDSDFRRDAIYTVTKDKELFAQINRLSDFSVRKDAKLSLKYLSDEFGALPKLVRE